MESFIPDIPLACFSLKFQVAGQITFPFPYIPAKLTLPKIAKDERTATSVNSATKSSVLIRSLGLPDVGQALERLYLSHTLFRNLVAYADPSRKLPDTDLALSTLGITDDGKTQASGPAMARAAFSMHLESQAISLRPEALANSQEQIKYQVTTAMFPLMDAAIAQRYLLEDPNGVPIPRTNVPRWRENTLRADFHIIPGTVDSASGLADGILDAGQPNTANAIIHCKPSWAYTDEILAQIFVAGQLEDENGSFIFVDETTRGQMMTQFWGSLVAMRCNFGMWSNGKKVFFSVRIGNDLICTPPLEWATRDTIRAMMGLTYAALDSEKWRTDRQVDLATVLVGQRTRIRNV